MPKLNASNYYSLIKHVLQYYSVDRLGYRQGKQESNADVVKN